MRPRLGDRYEILRPLGQGGMSTVFAARDLRTGQEVAIKWLGEPGFVPTDNELRRFEQEARIAGALDSPHVGRVADVGRDAESGVPYLVMDLLPGEDLQVLLDRSGALAVDTAVRIAVQAATGLAAAHAAGVVHRDVKPSNLFLTRREGGEVIVKVVDFGIAKIRRPLPGMPGASAALPAPPVSMTKSGEVLGSPLYMSPEQVEASRHVDARSDVFSLGVTLYAMLTGAAPYAHLRSFVQLLYSIVNVPPPPLATSAPWVPAAVAAVVDRCLSPDAAARYADGAALLAALSACAPEGSALREELLVGVGPGHAALRAPGASALAETEGAATEHAAVGKPDAKASLWRRFRGWWE